MPYFYNVASTDLHFTAPYSPITCDGAAVVKLTASLQAQGDDRGYFIVRLNYAISYLDIDGNPLTTCQPALRIPIDLKQPASYYKLHKTAGKDLYNFISDCTNRLVTELILAERVGNANAPTPICDESRRDYLNPIIMKALYNMMRVSPFDCTGTQAELFYKNTQANYLCHIRAYN